MINYKIKVRQGIDDLKSMYPYDGEWGIFHAYYNITEEEYLKDVKGYVAKIAYDNQQYIEKLKNEGKYGEIVVYTISMEENKYFDTGDDSKKDYPLTSYKFIII